MLCVIPAMIRSSNQDAKVYSATIIICTALYLNDVSMLSSLFCDYKSNVFAILCACGDGIVPCSSAENYRLKT